MLLLVLLAVPACEVRLELGTVAAKVVIEEWAQANVLKSLDDLLANALEKDEVAEEVTDETEEVSPE